MFSSSLQNDVLELWVCELCFSWPPDFCLDIDIPVLIVNESCRRVPKVDKFLA